MSSHFCQIYLFFVSTYHHCCLRFRHVHYVSLVKSISFWQHLYFLRTVIKPESEQGFCCRNHRHCFSITALPNAHSSDLQSFWSLLELVPAEWTDWWVGGGVCARVRVYMWLRVHIHTQTRGCIYGATFGIYCVISRWWSDCWMRSRTHSIRPSP